MSRFVKKDAKEPFEINTENHAVYICMCGLSKKQPFCDGSHKLTQDEENDKVYMYDNGKRVQVNY